MKNKIKYLRYYIRSKKEVERVRIINDTNGLNIDIAFRDNTYINTIITHKLLEYIHNSYNIIEVANKILKRKLVC